MFFFTIDHLKSVVYFDWNMRHLEFSVLALDNNWLGILEESFNGWVLKWSTGVYQNWYLFVASRFGDDDDIVIFCLVFEHYA